MARAKKSTKKKAGFLSDFDFAKHAQVFGETLGRSLRPFLPLLILTALYAIVGLLLWKPIGKDPRAVLTEKLLIDNFRKTKHPEWIPPADVNALAQNGSEFRGRSVFDPDLAKNLAAAYERSPWVKRVNLVRVNYPAEIQVDYIARKPFALIDSSHGPLVLDEDGAVLPISAQDLANPNMRGKVDLLLPSIFRVRCLAVVPGESVREHEVHEGLQLLKTAHEILGRTPWQLEAIRVERDPNGTWRVFVNNLTSGPTIEWGFWPDEIRPPGEPTQREKRAFLIKHLEEIDLMRVRTIRLNMPRAPVVPGY